MICVPEKSFLSNSFNLKLNTAYAAHYVFSSLMTLFVSIELLKHIQEVGLLISIMLTVYLA